VGDFSINLTNVKGLKRFLGMVNYLAKCLPLLSDMTEPLRRLEDKDVEWCWLEQHQQAYDTVKKSLAKAPVLRYYDVSKEVTIECDASETSLGAVLTQNGQPVVFASRALTDTEISYAQIEKELLAIFWATSKFDQYILGRETVNIESDHEPLKAVSSNLYIARLNGCRECCWPSKITISTCSTRKANSCGYRTP
jgi:hypothetical protein